MYSLHRKKFSISGKAVEIFVPDESQLKQLYKEGKIAFPFWSQVWPSAIALSEYVMEHPEMICNKKILELAAGLGLPSLFASYYASQVVCSDQDKEAVAIINRSIQHNGIKNCTASVLDWNDLPVNLEADVLLLSDINYDPETFPSLQSMIRDFLQKQTRIILSTPQRLMAKEFVDAIIPYTFSREDRAVGPVMTSIFLLGKF
jgi:methyltransferase-like protein 23